MNVLRFLRRLRQALGIEELRRTKAEVQEIVDKADRQEAEVQEARKHADTRSLEVRRHCEDHSTRLAVTKAMLETELRDQLAREAAEYGRNGTLTPPAEAEPTSSE
jgi:hypothetical protein